ncbi:hypothetical protein AHAS_Ahas11G0206000, partial [Arachis hypogaea]
LVPQDKLLIDASSGGSLTKKKTTEEAWEVIVDLADSNQHLRIKNTQIKAIGEVSPFGDAILTKTLGEMTVLIRQITQGPISTKAIKDLITMEETKVKGGETTPIKGGFNHLKLNLTPTNKPIIINFLKSNNLAINHHNLTIHHINHKAHLMPNPINNHIPNLMQGINHHTLGLPSLKIVNLPLQTNLI